MQPTNHVPWIPATSFVLLLLLIAALPAIRILSTATSAVASTELRAASPARPSGVVLPGGPAPTPVVAPSEAAVAASPASSAGASVSAPLAPPPLGAPVPALEPIGRGRVVAGAQATPVVGAFVSNGDTIVQTDEAGWFTLPPGPDGAVISVVAAGYRPLRGQSLAGSETLTLEPFSARALYLPYEQLWEPNSLDWALGLARDGVINALVVDVKEEGGGVLPLAATDAVLSLGAVVDPGTDVQTFLDELAELGVYRIARVVTFLDRRFATVFADDAIRTTSGVLLDDGRYAWSDPFSERARAYNLAIAERAATVFDEIQFDYVRFPGNPQLPLREETSGPERSAAIADFAAQAASALHRQGVALSFATFGVTTVELEEGGIGQVLEDLAPHLDYYAPMLYPSTWPAGSFNHLYPAAHPASVVGQATAAAVERARPWPTMRVRPWLQDFTDYGPLELPYGRTEVFAQIDAVSAAGAQGFTLWDPSLNYALGR